jgi:penicillin-binding protein 1A
MVRWGALACIWGALALIGLFAFYAYDIPRVSEVGSIERQPSMVLMAVDGTLLASYGDIYGAAVEVRDLPPALPQAVIAIEDRRFYNHFGVDPRGLARAMVANFRAGRIVQGGSTITQQLAKNLFLSPERTLKRKVQELLLAFWLERKFTKDQILSLYLNRVYLGAGTFGVDAAARRYFGKGADAINLYEAAILAGLLKAPTRFSPARNTDLAHDRATLVLGAMVEEGFVAEASAEQALKERTRGRPATGAQARYFADWIVPQVQSFIGEFDQDITVITTLNPYIQKVAEEELVRMLEEEGENRGVDQAALVIMDPDGALRAMVGGRSFDASQFNRATQAMRQPGSAFKPFVYLAAVEAGFTPDMRMMDAPVSLAGWAPRNYNDKYFGEVTLREAFARSLNSVAVQLSERVGREKILQTAKRLGISSPLSAHPSIALGTSEVTLLELTGAYAAFANRGHGAWPFGIEEIRAADGTLLYRRQGSGPGQLVGAGELADMQNLMTASVEWGSGKGAKLGRPAAGKTGTSQESRDAWFVGYTAELVAGVWMGNDDASPTKGLTGGSLPAVLWARVMHRALDGVAPQPLPQAEGPLIALDTDSIGGFLNRLIEGLTGAAPEDPAPANENQAQASPSKQSIKHQKVQNQR